jgi:hypothetical protein
LKTHVLKPGVICQHGVPLEPDTVEKCKVPLVKINAGGLVGMLELLFLFEWL